MSLPEEDDGLFEKIEFLDLDKQEAAALVAKYNEEGEAYKKKMDEKYPERNREKSYRDSRDDKRDSRRYSTFFNLQGCL